MNFSSPGGVGSGFRIRVNIEQGGFFDEFLSRINREMPKKIIPLVGFVRGDFKWKTKIDLGGLDFMVKL